MLQSYNVNAHVRAANAATKKETKPLFSPAELGEPERGGKYTYREDVLNMHGGGWGVFSPTGEFICSRRQEGPARTLAAQLNKSNKL
jgi:hypothetical protein